MPNSENIKLTGFLPIVIATALICSILSAVAAYILPKNTEHAVPDLELHASELAQPLANTMMMQGFNQAKAMLSGVSANSNNTQYYLYSMTGVSEPALIYKTGDQAVKPISQQKLFSVGNVITVHQPLKLDGQYLGELILQYTKPSTPTYTALAYGLFAFAILLAIVLAALAHRQLVAKLAADNKKLQNSLRKVTEEQNYGDYIDSNLGFGLDNTANSINDVLQQVQSVIDNNQESQKELKQLQTSLETEVQSRTLALEKATMNAERANEAKTTFLATMSHEIRTPMNGVIGTIDLLRQTELDGAQHRLTTIIRDSAFSLLGILDDILDFSKIEAGKLQIDNTAFSVTDTIEEVARVLSSVARKRKLDLQLSIAPDIPKNLVGDNIRVRQVLYNLCSNAIKFTTTDENRQGFVKVAVEVAQNTSEHYTLRFSVTDNGKGMTQLQLREIFNPFIQAENSITREYGGTGLGLSICKSLIELMLGSINVTSDLGMGSEFVVELPFSTRGKVEYAHKGALGQRKVVVLTSNLSRRAILCRYLSFMGANAFAIDSISEADEFQHSKNIIWVLDGLDGMAPVNDQLRSLLYSLEQNDQQVIVLSTMDEAALNHQKIFYLNAAPLCKSSFMTSVMVAAGLHKPKELKQAKTLNNYLNVDQARAENKLVLLVEDNVLNQQVLTDQLHLLGYGVEVAENGEEGLALWKKGHYPIILTDLHMPKMSGYDMVKGIRDLAEKSNDIKAQPYIIAVTANALKGERDKCISTGMNDYITKPVELNLLEAILAKWDPEKHVQPQTTKNTEATDTTEIVNESALEQRASETATNEIQTEHLQANTHSVESDTTSVSNTDTIDTLGQNANIVTSESNDNIHDLSQSVIEPSSADAYELPTDVLEPVPEQNDNIVTSESCDDIHDLSQSSIEPSSADAYELPTELLEPVPEQNDKIVTSESSDDIHDLSQSVIESSLEDAYELPSELHELAPEKNDNIVTSESSDDIHDLSQSANEPSPLDAYELPSELLESAPEQNDTLVSAESSEDIHDLSHSFDNHTMSDADQALAELLEQTGTSSEPHINLEQLETSINDDESIPQIDLSNTASADLISSDVIENDSDSTTDINDSEPDEADTAQAKTVAPQDASLAPLEWTGSPISTSYEKAQLAKQEAPSTFKTPSFELESNWQAEPKAEVDKSKVPVPSFALAPEGTSQATVDGPSADIEPDPTPIKAIVEEPEVTGAQPISEQAERGITDNAVKSSIETAPDTVEATSPDLPVIDLHTLDNYISNDEAKKIRFFNMYLDQSAKLTGEISGAVVANDQAAVASSCHQLKSISKTIGAMQVAEIAVQFEQACKSGELDSNALLAQRNVLDSAYLDAVAFIKDYISQADV